MSLKGRIVSGLTRRAFSELHRATTKVIAQELTLSETCVNRLNTLTNGTNKFLRVIVESGGCSGFQYKFALDSNLNEDDRVFEKGGAKVIIDEISLEYVKGSTIDYCDELIRTSFKIVNNPIAEKGCSCGSSFAVRLD